KLQPNRQLIGGTGICALQITNAVVDPLEMLDVMPELVGDDICLRKVAGRPEAAIELVEEAQVQIHFLVEWTIERSHRRLSRAASRRGAVAKEDQIRGTELRARAREFFLPRLLCVVEHEGNELNHRLLARGVRGGKPHFAAGRGRRAVVGVRQNSRSEDE